MELLVGLFIVIVILGALVGGRSFGGTIVKGLGCLTVLVFGLIVLLVLT